MWLAQNTQSILHFLFHFQYIYLFIWIDSTPISNRTPFRTQSIWFLHDLWSGISSYLNPTIAADAVSLSRCFSVSKCIRSYIYISYIGRLSNQIILLLLLFFPIQNIDSMGVNSNKNIIIYSYTLLGLRNRGRGEKIRQRMWCIIKVDINS